MQLMRSLSKRTITDFFAFVIFICVVFLIFSSCSSVSSEQAESSKGPHYFPPKVVGRITNPDITESSGIAASKCSPNVYWTHNDSGDDAFIFAVNAKGETLGTWKVTGAQNQDWEDIAEFKDSKGKCFVYIGEIGDNNQKRAEHLIYRISEPQVRTEDSGTTRSSPRQTEPAETLRFRYPDSIHDAETLLVHPRSGEIYVLSKRLNGPAGVYHLKPAFGSTITAVKITDLAVPAIPNGYVTGGDISPDGKRMIICDYTGGYEYTLPVGDENFDDIWKQQAEIVDLGERKQGEGICYSADGNTLYATSEGKSSPLIEIRRRP